MFRILRSFPRGRWLALCILLVPRLVAGEDVPPSDPPVEGEEKEDDQTKLTLYQESLVKDIDTSDYYDLLVWCRMLGLDEKGDKRELQERLYTFYKLRPPDRPFREKGLLVQIESADRVGHFNVEEVDEDIIEMTGKVVLTVTRQNQVYRLEADKIRINKTQKIITAVGKVRYRKEDATEFAFLEGDSFSIEVDTWKGVLFKGVAEKTYGRKGETKFYYSAEEVRQFGNVIKVLDKGIIATGKGDLPLFRIKAKRIWILGPGEWAIGRGTLFMGEVPLLYVPFYYKHGGDLFFNPAFGYQKRAGFFVQTTSYLLGMKEIEGSRHFQFLGSDKSSPRERERKGLYLVDTEKKLPVTSERTLKVIADFYTKLGGVSGLIGDFRDLPLSGRLDFLLGIGVSRSVTQEGHLVFHQGSNRSRWNHSVLYGVRLPFRFGVEFNFSFPLLRGQFAYYTDPYFKGDFLIEREENFDWIDFSLSTKIEREKRKRQTVSQALRWLLEGRWNLSFAPLKPWISSGFLTYKGVVGWRRRTNKAVIQEDRYAPARQVFYLDEIILPYLTSTVEGTLFSFPRKGRSLLSKGTGSGNILEELRLPWDKEESSKEETFPSQLGNLPQGEALLWQEDEDSRLEEIKAEIGYRFSSNLEIKTRTKSPQGGVFESIVLHPASLVTEGDLNFHYNTGFMGESVVLRGKNRFVARHGQYFLLGESHLPITEAMEKRALRDRSRHLYGDWSFSVSPFKHLYAPLAKTHIRYVLNTILYQERLTAGKDVSGSKPSPQEKKRWIRWEKEYIRRHGLGIDVVYQLSPFDLSIDYRQNFPPGLKSIAVTPQVKIRLFEKWNTTLQFFFETRESEKPKKEEAWATRLLMFDTSYQYEGEIGIFRPEPTIKTALEYDLSTEEFRKYSLNLRLYHVYLNYTMSRSPHPFWKGRAGGGWSEKEERFGPSSLVAGYEHTFKMAPLWKRRITQRLSIDTHYDVNLRMYNKMALTFALSYQLSIYQLLDITVSVTSVNRGMFLYFPHLREFFNIKEEYNFFQDLLKSFNFFNTQDRIDSYFNMEEFRLGIVHHFHDWDLTLQYKGRPRRKAAGYVWDSQVQLLVQWNPIPLFKTEIQYEDDVLRASRE